MNEIDKLKIENARFKKALCQIYREYRTDSDAHKYADAALNPPPPAPVTLPEVLHALNRYKTESGDFVAIFFNPDESGNILTGLREEVAFEFATLRDAINFLNGDI